MITHMKRDDLIQQLEDQARLQGIEIRKGKYEGKSGMGKWKDRWVLLIDRSLTPQERVELLTDALRESGVDNAPVTR